MDFLKFKSFSENKSSEEIVVFLFDKIFEFPTTKKRRDFEMAMIIKMCYFSSACDEVTLYSMEVTPTEVQITIHIII